MITFAETNVKNNSELNEVEEDEADKDKDQEMEFNALVNKYQGFKKSL